MNSVVDRIDFLLGDRGISGYKMCSDLGMSKSFLTELRKGRAKSIKIETAKKIAGYFGVTVDYLLGNVNDPFFYLDNERILREINSYGDELTQKEKAPAEAEADDVGMLMDELQDKLRSGGDIMFNGYKLSPESAAALAASIEAVDAMTAKLAEQEKDKG